MASAGLSAIAHRGDEKNYSRLFVHLQFHLFWGASLYYIYQYKYITAGSVKENCSTRLTNSIPRAVWYLQIICRGRSQHDIEFRWVREGEKIDGTNATVRLLLNIYIERKILLTGNVLLCHSWSCIVSARYRYIKRFSVERIYFIWNIYIYELQNRKHSRDVFNCVWYIRYDLYKALFLCPVCYFFNTIHQEKHPWTLTRKHALALHFYAISSSYCTYLVLSIDTCTTSDVLRHYVWPHAFKRVEATVTIYRYCQYVCT